MGLRSLSPNFPKFSQVKTLDDLQKTAKEGFGDSANELFKLFPASDDAESVKKEQIDTIFVDRLNTELIEFLRAHPLARLRPGGGR